MEEWWSSLTPRQQEILPLLAEGKTNRAIANDLGLSLDRVKWHVSEILLKTGSANRAEAAAKYAADRR